MVNQLLPDKDYLPVYMYSWLANAWSQNRDLCSVHMHGMTNPHIDCPCLHAWQATFHQWAIWCLVNLFDPYSLFLNWKFLLSSSLYVYSWFIFIFISQCMGGSKKPPGRYNMASSIDNWWLCEIDINISACFITMQEKWNSWPFSAD